jgi:hypothetical protein
MLPLLALIVVAAPVEKLVITDVQTFDKSLKPLAAQTQERMATELSRLSRFEVMTSADVAALLGQERQRQLLGCTEDSSACMAEIGDALGSPWLVTASLNTSTAQGSGSPRYRFDFKLISVSKGTVVVRDGGDVTADELPALVLQAVRGVQATLGAEQRAPATVSAVAPVTLMVAGAAALVGGGLGITLIQIEKADIERNQAMVAAKTIEAFNARLQIYRPLWIVTAAVGAVAATVGLVWWLNQSKPVGAAVSLWVAPTWNGVQVSGRF